MKEWRCMGHGTFESDEPVCPRGCTAVQREFRTPPAFHNGTTSKTDALLRSQVEAFGLSNIKTNLREGDTARIQSPAERQQAEFQKAVRQKYPRNWGALPQGGVAAAVAGMKTKSAAEVEAATGTSMNEDFTSQVRGKKHAYEAVRDSQNLKLDVSKAA